MPLKFLKCTGSTLVVYVLSIHTARDDIFPANVESLWNTIIMIMQSFHRHMT